MKSKTVNVIITVHVEERAKFIQDCHLGHLKFFKLLLNDKCKIPMTLLIERVKEKEDCPYCDKSLLDEINEQGIMEIGLHVHPALSRFSYERQSSIIRREYNIFVDSTGIVPSSFSGGHWCINLDTLNIIRKLNMKVDASVAPGCSVYSCHGTVVKYPNTLTDPYWISFESMGKEDPDSPLLEIPVSTNLDGRIMDLYSIDLWDLLTSIYIKNFSRSGTDYLHMTFHSYDVLFPDGSRNFFYDKIMFLCEKLYDLYDKVNFMTCSQYYSKKRKGIL